MGQQLLGDIPSRETTSEPLELTEERLRRWLSLLRQPDKLATEEIQDLLKAHDALPESRSPLALGQAGAQLLLNAIERLRPPQSASREESLPHEVLNKCFIEGAKLFQAAGTLGLSERQLSRERSRAIRLLKAELEIVPHGGTRPDLLPEPIPRIRGFLDRPAEKRKIDKALETSRLVVVHGAPGIGKTTLAAEVVAEGNGSPVLWYRFRPGVNTSLSAVLFELADHLRAIGSDDLFQYLNDALPAIDVPVATRLAIRGLGNHSHILAFDDFQLVEDDSAIKGLIEEMIERLPQIRVIAISQHRYSGMMDAEAVEVGPLARAQSAKLLTSLGVTCTEQTSKALHTWTNGNPHMLKLAAAWLKKASPEQVAEGVNAFREQVDVQSFLLGQVTNLIDPDDHKILRGASIFRSQFSDDALAYVTGRTKGAVIDSSMRLVRSYVATRNREGDSAFFHNSIREFIYDRLNPEQREDLHSRAADWFETEGNTVEAQYHRRCALAVRT